MQCIRHARQLHAKAALNDELSCADQAAFQIARHEIIHRANDYLNDVQAAKNGKPAARTIKNDK